MGIESFNIMILPKNVNIIRDGEYWRLCGTTEIAIESVENELKEMYNIRRKKREEYVMDECIDVKLYENEQCFQGFELRGCLSYLRGGIEVCYNFYEYWKDKIPMKVCILNQVVQVIDVSELYQTLCNMYSQKIKIFKKQYGDIELKTTSGSFYIEIKKRKRWYYRLFSNMLKRNNKCKRE